MKKVIFFIFLIIALLLFGFWSIKTFAQAKTLPAPKAYIIETAGDAQIKSAGSNNWEIIAKDREIKPGDEIKTGSDGQISINFYNTSSSRIGPESQITIDQATIDKYNYAKTKVSLMVTLGRVWSRIINLADREASFETGSNSTVATVRGTTIDFERTKDEQDKINAVESIVTVSLLANEGTSTQPNKNELRRILKSINLVQGSGATIVAGEQKEIVVQPIPVEEKNTTWFNKNQQNDRKFEEEMKNLKEAQNQEIAGILPDSSLYKIKKIAESARVALTFDPNEKQALEVSFLNRRLAEAQELINDGKAGLAENVANEFAAKTQKFYQSAAKSQISQDNLNNLDGQIHNQINLQEQLLANTTPDNPAYGIKSKLEQLNLEITNNEGDKKFLQYKNLETKLKESELLKNENKNNLSEEQMKAYLEGLKTLGTQIDPELIERLKLLSETLKPTLESIPLQKLDVNTQTDALINGLKTLNDLAPQIIPQIEKIITPLIQKTDTTQPTPVIPKTNITKPLVGPTTPTTTTILPPPPPPEIRMEIKLSKLSVSASKYNILAQSTQQFQATAQYSNGSTKDVTGEANWSISGDIGTISSSGLVQPDADGGSGNVSASYTENGVTVSATSRTITALTLEQ